MIGVGIGVGIAGGRGEVLPTSFAGLQLWLRADRAFTDTGRTTLCSIDGDLAAALEDLSGNGRHLTQSTSANRPAWYSESLPYMPNFRPVLVCDGINDYLSSSSFSFGAYPMTVFAVARRNNATASVIGAICGQFSSGSPGSTTVAIRSGDGTTLTNGVGFCQGTGPANLSDGMTGFTDATWFVWEFCVLAGTVDLKRNGSSNGTTAGTPAGLGSQPFSLGARFNTGADPFPGAIAEVVAYTGADSGRDAAIRAYLGTRYGITVS